MSEMIRRTRTRQTRIHVALQSGYCAICHVPYNSLDDHIQSKKHMKLIGEDANYISINGFIDQNGLEPYLNLNGIDSIDVNGKLMDKEPPPRATRMTRAKSVAPIEVPKVKAPKNGHEPTHHLRSRKQINYSLSPIIDEDSFDRFEAAKCKRSTRSAPKTVANSQEEVWNSGRPKRSTCVRSNKALYDEKLHYKVEVVTPKLKPKDLEMATKVKTEDDKGLIVKFKKMRNSELMLLNNEAENFLFPRKEESGDEDDKSCTKIKREDYHDEKKFKVEDENSFDSTCSSRKKKRRTHAEAFIMDNQKYYKFETPGSRLRYQGSIFTDFILKSPKHNGFVDPSKKHDDEKKDRKEKKRREIDLDNYKYSFETVPKAERWYETFRRQDLGDEMFYLNEDMFSTRMVLPYQIGPLPPLDPKVCINSFLQLKKLLQDHAASSSGGCTPDSCAENREVSEINDDISEISVGPSELGSENSNQEEPKKVSKKTPSVSSDGSNFDDDRHHRKKSDGKNPRKSPRQHASTLAILSNLIQQRKKRKDAKGECATKAEPLPTIPEEKVQAAPSVSEMAPKPITHDYEEILRNFDRVDEDMERFKDVDMSDTEPVDFRNTLNVLDVLEMCEKNRPKEQQPKPARGVPGRKPGRRKKKNRTGWPNRKRPGKRHDRDSDNTEDSGIDEPTHQKSRVENKIEIVRLPDCDKANRVERAAKVKRNKRVKVNASDKVKGRKRRASLSPKRTAKKRRMPGSPKSPRSLRKPRGRWYKER